MRQTDDTKQYQKYFDGLRRDRERLERFLDYRQMANRVAHALCTELDASAVYLVGSLLDQDAFDFTSDIDLALEGIPAAQYLDAVRVAEEVLAGRPFDVILLDSLNEEERVHLKSEGEVLYARQT